MSRQRSDPAEWRTRRNNRPPSIAHMPGSCDACSLDINPGDPIQRVRGREMHIACAGKE